MPKKILLISLPVLSVTYNDNARNVDQLSSTHNEEMENQDIELRNSNSIASHKQYYRMTPELADECTSTDSEISANLSNIKNIKARSDQEKDLTQIAENSSKTTSRCLDERCAVTQTGNCLSIEAGKSLKPLDGEMNIDENFICKAPNDFTVCDANEKIHILTTETMPICCVVPSCDREENVKGNNYSSLPLPDLILPTQESRGPSTFHDGDAKEKYDADDDSASCRSVEALRTKELQCQSDLESDSPQFDWDSYQPIYTSISDDASEEKLDATCLQADWQPDQEDDDDCHDTIPVRRILQKHADAIVDSDDSDNDDFVDVIKTAVKAERVIQRTLAKLEAEKSDQRKHQQQLKDNRKEWNKFKNALATCRTSIECLSDLLAALELNSTGFGAATSSTSDTHHNSTAPMVNIVRDVNNLPTYTEQADQTIGIGNIEPVISRPMTLNFQSKSLGSTECEHSKIEQEIDLETPTQQKFDDLSDQRCDTGFVEADSATQKQVKRVEIFARDLPTQEHNDFQGESIKTNIFFDIVEDAATAASEFVKSPEETRADLEFPQNKDKNRKQNHSAFEDRVSPSVCKKETRPNSKSIKQMESNDSVLSGDSNVSLVSLLQTQLTHNTACASSKIRLSIPKFPILQDNEGNIFSKTVAPTTGINRQERNRYERDTMSSKVALLGKLPLAVVFILLLILLFVALAALDDVCVIINPVLQYVHGPPPI